MRKKKIKKLIIKKSIATYYRMLAIFMLIFVIISSYSAFYFFSQSINAKNFYENKNARLIKVKGRTNNNIFSNLNKEDLEQIQIILNESGKDYKLSSIFKISSGILNANDDKGVIIYGIDNTFTDMMNNEFLLQDDVLYSDLDTDKIQLIIPNIEFTSNGDIISNSYKEVTYEIENNSNLLKDKAVKNFFSARTENLPIIFSSQKTFLDILKIMFDNKKGITYSDEEIYDFIDVAEVFIYVYDIHNIDSVVDNLESNNFYVIYAFGSFERDCK